MSRLVIVGDDRHIPAVGRHITGVRVDLTYLNPAVLWSLGLVMPDLLHDACFDGEAIR